MKKNDKNQSGQMAIFIAILFQMLFVLFAMSINVGLVVHDKVNLQNSVDLAAYYGAQKQAELLNVMAHVNYQIRQSYKLLAWRYRVMGQFGIGGDDLNMPMYHPARPRFQGSPGENAFLPYPGGADPASKEIPVICMGYSPHWKGASARDNFCKIRAGSIPLATTSGVNISPLTGSLIKDVIKSVEGVNQLTRQNCQHMVAENYLFGAISLTAFRWDQLNRKQVIVGLANNMMSDKGSFNDLNGENIFEGVQNMIEKNLTFTNLYGFQETEVFNSLEGSRLGEWLNEIQIAPNLLYVDPKGANCNQSGDDVNKFIAQLPTSAVAQDRIKQYDETGVIVTYASNDYSQNVKLENYSIGFEKNPWNWVYYGVKATTTTRPLFFPFGDDLKISAKAFAKPFGGRMGPWYNQSWSKGSTYSNGGEKVDPLMAPAITPGSGGISDDKRQDTTRYPNYSRFPGDRLGLKSTGALSAMKGFDARYRGAGAGISDYMDGAKIMVDGEINDILAWRRGGGGEGAASPLRNFEIAAVAPDLFDITYYSIDPHFDRVYLPKLQQNKQKILKPGAGLEDISSIAIRGDLGSREKPMSIKEQIDIVQNSPGVIDEKLGFAYVKNKKHLLTAWLHGLRAMDFTNDNAKGWFANCESWDDERNFKVPGSCLQNGGRVGYSVKLISKGIFDQSIEVSGSKGKINNPPPDDF